MLKQLTETCCSYSLKAFVYAEVLQPSQPNEVMLSMVSLPNYTFTGQAVNQYSHMHILSPELTTALLESAEVRMTVEKMS